MDKKERKNITNYDEWNIRKHNKSNKAKQISTKYNKSDKGKKRKLNINVQRNDVQQRKNITKILQKTINLEIIIII